MPVEGGGGGGCCIWTVLKKCSVTKAQPRLFGAAADPADNPNAAENRKSRVPRGLGDVAKGKEVHRGKGQGNPRSSR